MTTSTSYSGIDRDVPQSAGLDAETRAMKKLSSLGFSVRKMPHPSPFDLIVGAGKRIEVKYARPTVDGHWAINIHRHGIVNEKNCDFYLVLLDGIPGGKKTTLYLIIPSPLRKATVDFSFATLLRRWNQYIDNWTVLGDVKPRNAPRACLGKMAPAALRTVTRKPQ